MKLTGKTLSNFGNVAKTVYTVARLKGDEDGKERGEKENPNIYISPSHTHTRAHTHPPQLG